jgi:hypothetical protein
MTEKADTFVDHIVRLADNAPRDKDMETIRDVASEVLQGKDEPETGDTKRAVSMLEDRGVVQRYQWIESGMGDYTFMPGTHDDPSSSSPVSGPIAMRIFRGLVQVRHSWGHKVVGDTVALCQAAQRGLAVRDTVENNELMDYTPVPLHKHKWKRDVPDARGENLSLDEHAVYHTAFRAGSEHPEKHPSLAQIEKAVMEGVRCVRALEVAHEETQAPETTTTA